jgi:hypothetical protein
MAHDPADAFTSFWSEVFGKMSGSGMGSAFGPTQEETNRVMRGMMKKSMDNAVAFRQQLNELLSKTLEHSQIPTRGDTDSILLAVRHFEQRVLDRLDALAQRVEELERREGSPARGAAGPSKPRAKGVPQ